jgi:hypothetical protein
MMENRVQRRLDDAGAVHRHQSGPDTARTQHTIPVLLCDDCSTTSTDKQHTILYTTIKEDLMEIDDVRTDGRT